MKKLLITLTLISSMSVFAEAEVDSYGPTNIIEHETCQVTDFKLINSDVITMTVAKKHLKDKGYKLVATPTLKYDSKNVSFKDEKSEGLTIRIGATEQNRPFQVQYQIHGTDSAFVAFVNTIAINVDFNYRKLVHAIENLGHSKMAFVGGQGLEKSVMNSQSSILSLGNNTTEYLRDVTRAMDLLPSCKMTE
jgi:hypothetical protein